jgi:hypothetical protein
VIKRIVTGGIAAIVLGALFLWGGYVWGRAVAVPNTTEFWKTFGQPIATFGGAVCTLAVGALALFGVVSTNAATRKHSERSEELNRCWERFTWLIEQTAGTSGDGPEVFPTEVVSEVVKSLVADAIRLKDRTLEAALTEYQLVVANQFADALGLAPEQ